MLYTLGLSLLSYSWDIDRQVVGVGKEAEMVLTGSFYINEWRGIDFIEPACIDL